MKYSDLTHFQMVRSSSKIVCHGVIAKYGRPSALGARINEGDDPLYSSRSAAGEDELAAGVGEDGGTKQDGGGERDQSSIETESIDQFSDNDKTGQDANVTGADGSQGPEPGE